MRGNEKWLLEIFYNGLVWDEKEKEKNVDVLFKIIGFDNVNI